jgi:ribosomal protein S18 acetylase RimI-like enzyme
MYHFEFQEIPGEKESQALLDGIRVEASLKKGMIHSITPFGIFVKDVDSKILGGVEGVTYYGALYIDMLWVNEELRFQGIGTKLVQEAENIGKKRKCTFSTVNTMDWEALPFYKSLGYKVEFTRHGYEKQSQMYFLKKEFS